MRKTVTGVEGEIRGRGKEGLHDNGRRAGKDRIEGNGGTALLGEIGLRARKQMMLRKRRRFGTWRAPAIALGVFTAMFALSAFVIGPAIGGANTSTGTGTNAPSPAVDHASHHGK